MTTNDAAERLRLGILNRNADYLMYVATTDLDAALAAERRAATRNARIVAEYWRDEMMGTEGALRACSHPLACVIGALDGEDDPVEMGIPAAEFARRAAILDAEAER